MKDEIKNIVYLIIYLIVGFVWLVAGILTIIGSKFTFNGLLCIFISLLFTSIGIINYKNRKKKDNK